MIKEDSIWYYALIISHHLYDVSFDINRIPSKTGMTHCKTQRGKPLYNYIQLSLAGTFVILTYHQLSAARPYWEDLHFWTSTSAHSRPHSTLLYLKLPDCMPYVCVYSIFPQFISPALRNGLTPPRHQCQSDEWVSNSVWSSHQRHAALNARPWQKKQGGERHHRNKGWGGREQLERGMNFILFTEPYYSTGLGWACGSQDCYANKSTYLIPHRI